MAYRKPVTEKIFDVFNIVFMLVIVAVSLYPFLFVVFASLSDPAIMGSQRGILLYPQGFQTDGYRLVFEKQDVWTGYANTIFYVVAGTFLNVTLTAMLAYTLSKKGLLLNKIIMMGIVFTMFFSGGMIPSYLLINNLHLVDSRWAIVLSGLVSTMNVIIMRTSFQSLPESLEEAAKLDGANEFTILFRIVIPLSMPVIAVMTLFYGVGRWNSWFDAMIYLKDRNKMPLQIILREILIYSSTDDMMTTLGTDKKGHDMSEIIKYATTVVATVPILIIYPFIQKYFAKGVMIGAIKG